MGDYARFILTKRSRVWKGANRGFTAPRTLRVFQLPTPPTLEEILSCRICQGHGKTSYGSLTGEIETCARCNGTGIDTSEFR